MQPMLMDRLYTFLSLLTTGMHEVSLGSKVIWYDSVTVDGNLKWQNSLNKLNQLVINTVSFHVQYCPEVDSWCVVCV